MPSNNLCLLNAKTGFGIMLPHNWHPVKLFHPIMKQCASRWLELPRNVPSYVPVHATEDALCTTWFSCSLNIQFKACLEIDNVANCQNKCLVFTGCGCLPKQSVFIYSTNFTRLQAGPLVIRHSDKRRVVTDVNTLPNIDLQIGVHYLAILMLSEQFWRMPPSKKSKQKNLSLKNKL